MKWGECVVDEPWVPSGIAAGAPTSRGRKTIPGCAPRWKGAGAGVWTTPGKARSHMRLGGRRSGRVLGPPFGGRHLLGL